MEGDHERLTNDGVNHGEREPRETLSSSSGGSEGHASQDHRGHGHSHSHSHSHDGSDADDEESHFGSVCSAYRQYANFAMAQWANREYRFRSLPEAHRNVLPSTLLGGGGGDKDYAQSFNRYREAVIRNQFCLDCVLKHAGQPNSQQAPDDDVASVTDEQVSKVSSVLKSLARDWSAEGQVERDKAYLPVIRHIQNYKPLGTGKERDTCTDQDMDANTPPRVCVPGSGLGRLSFELIRLGYTVQGNDFSLHMLLASDFILNSGIFSPDRPLNVSPWLLESRNVCSRDDPVRTVQIPDVDPHAALLSSVSVSSSSDRPGPDFSVAAGDFCAVYGHPKEAGRWDAVASCFFLDACPSIVEALHVIYRMLKPGGILVNLGPLLYHWSGPVLRPDDKSVQEYRDRYSHLDERYLTSVDLCYDDVREVVKNIGFEILEEETGIECLYTADRKSTMNTTYRCVSFVAKKPQPMLNAMDC